MLADPYTGVALFENDSWSITTIGGTSLATPLWAGLVALLDQERNMRGVGGVNVSSATSSWVYSSPTQTRDFNDITSGTDPGFVGDPCVAALLCSGTAGYDMTTGRGSPNWPNLLTDVAGTGPGALRTALTTVSPARIMDTRSGVGVAQGQMQAGETRTLQVTGLNAVPANAGAIVVNVGVTNPHSAQSGWDVLHGYTRT
jgi:subtilase family serine protease